MIARNYLGKTWTKATVGSTGIPHLMKEFREIKQFQVVQESLDKLIIKIVRNGLFNNGRLKFLQDEVRNVLGQNINIDIQFVNEILLTRTGKFRVTVSELG